MSAEMGTPTLRGWRDDDIAAFVAAGNAVVAADGLPYGWDEPIVREEILGWEGIDPARDILVAELDGAFAGATWIRHAIREGARQIDHDGFVRPDLRGRGVGRALVIAAETRARALAAELAAGPDAGSGRSIRLATVLHDADAAGIRILERRGFAPYRWYALMGRDLPGEGRDAAPLPPIEPVPGLALRPVAEADWRAIFEGLGEAFRDHFGHRDWSEADFEHLFRGPEVDTTLWRVAWDGDALAGASHNTISASECATLGVRQGWVDIIGVRRPWRGRGVARWLLAETMAEMARRGMERTILGVDLDNPTGALGLYESVGFLPLLRSTMWAKAIEPGTGGAPDGGAAG